MSEINFEDKLQQNKSKISNEIRRRIYDIIAAIIVVSLIAVSLNLFGLLDFTLISIADFLASWAPYFIAVILLNTDLYKKGVFVGKQTEKFKIVINDYSSFTEKLSGKQLKELEPFCKEYNNAALVRLKTEILKEEAIDYNDFDYVRTEIVDGKTITRKPIKILTKQELIAEGFTKNQRKVIKCAKSAKVKGLHSNVLLSSISIKDITNIGDDEKTLSKKYKIISTVRYSIITLLLSIIAIKNVYEWGWLAAIFVIFKVSYCFAGCYMSYFKAYDDITISLLNHFMRKTDILKMYLNYVPKDTMEDVENTSINK